MIVFSGRIDAPEVRCDLNRHTHEDRHNYRNPPAHARRGLSEAETACQKCVCVCVGGGGGGGGGLGVYEVYYIHSF